MSLEQNLFQAANRNGLKYQESFYCKHCGRWIKKVLAVFTFFTKINHTNTKPRLVNSKCPRCPDCHHKLKTRPVVRKAGRIELEKELIRY